MPLALHGPTRLLAPLDRLDMGWRDNAPFNYVFLLSIENLKVDTIIAWLSIIVY